MPVRYTVMTSMPDAAPLEIDRHPERERDARGESARHSPGSRGHARPATTGRAETRERESAGDRWRDKLELRLDNRQVFFLFFGSAVVACMLFILGVLVGKRIETRGQAEAAMPQDPLAALDRAHEPAPGTVAAAAEQELSFPSTLIGGPVNKGGKGAGHGKAPPAPVPAKTSVVSPAPKLLPGASAMAVAPKQAAAAPKLLAAAPAAPAPKLLAVAPAPPVLKSLAAAPASKLPSDKAKAGPSSVAKTSPAVPVTKTLAASVAKPPAPTADAPKAKGKFTLQLSTFTTAEDAAAFAGQYPGAFVVGGDTAGKGGAFRVRYGNFGSFQEAAAAKTTFEKQHNMIALVAAR
jgi:DedD protein